MSCGTIRALLLRCWWDQGCLISILWLCIPAFCNKWQIHSTEEEQKILFKREWREVFSNLAKQPYILLPARPVNLNGKIRKINVQLSISISMSNLYLYMEFHCTIFLLCNYLSSFLFRMILGEHQSQRAAADLNCFISHCSQSCYLERVTNLESRRAEFSSCFCSYFTEWPQAHPTFSQGFGLSFIKWRSDPEMRSLDPTIFNAESLFSLLSLAC